MQPLSAVITVEDDAITVVYDSGPIPVAIRTNTELSAVITPNIIAVTNVYVEHSRLKPDNAARTIAQTVLNTALKML